MSGVGNILNTSQRNIPSGFPFTSGSARNGLSVDATGRIVLGQDVGAVGNPAVLLNAREIPMNGFPFTMVSPLGSGNRFLLIDPTTNHYALGNLDALGPMAGGPAIVINPIADTVQFRFIDDLGGPLLLIGDRVANPIAQMISPNSTLACFLDETSGLASIQVNGGATVSCQVGTGKVLINSGAAQVFRSTQTQTNYAGAAAGTLNNAPHAGNPDKWVAFDDNGTLRKIPTWI